MNRVLLATSSPAFERRIRASVEGDANTSLQLLPRGVLPAGADSLLAHLPDGVPPDVMVLGPGVAVLDALELAARLDEQCPAISVVLVTEASNEVWLAGMRAGVRDVLAPEAEDDEIRTVLHRAMHVAELRRHAMGINDEDATVVGRVIIVASPKGGTGKTTVATNLAVGLARREPHSTVLVDLDVQFGDVASALQLRPDYSLTDAVAGPSSQDAMVLKTFLGLHATGLYALCAPDAPATGSHVTADQISKLLDLLALHFRYVVVDTAPGLGEHVLAALDRATDIVQVCGLDVPSVRGLRKELDVLAELGISPLAYTIVLNFADRHGGLSVRDVEGTIGRSVDIILPPSRAVLIATNHGIPLLQNDARNPVTKELRRLVARFVTPVTPAASPAALQRNGAQDRAGEAPVAGGRDGASRGRARAPRRWVRRVPTPG